MKLLEKILVTHDFTEASDRALNWAVETAKIFNSEIYLFSKIWRWRYSSRSARIFYERT